MTRLKDITFESGTLTGTNGADSATGSGAGIDASNSAAIKGSWLADVNTTGAAYVQEDWTATDSAYASVYLIVDTNPAAAGTFLEFRTGAAALARLRINTSGDLILTTSGSSQIGSPFTMNTGTTYRVGMRYTKGTGADAILEGFAIAGDSAFGAAFASTNSNAETAQVSRVRCGSPAGATLDLRFDNLRIDDASMPTDDVAASGTARYRRLRQGAGFGLRAGF